MHADTELTACRGNNVALSNGRTMAEAGEDMWDVGVVVM